MKSEIKWNGIRIELDYNAQLDNYHDTVAWYAEGHDVAGNRYEVVWQYLDPVVNNGSDFEDCADWDHPLEVNEQ